VKRINFFATKEDMVDLIMSVTYSGRLGVVTAQLLPENCFEVSADFSIVRPGDVYLIVPLDFDISARNVVQKDGGTKYAVDGVANPFAVSLNFGGVFEDGKILVSSLSSIGDNVYSANIYSLIEKAMRKKWKKAKMFFVSPKSEECLKDGWRLVSTKKSPPEYDFAL
jgi:hypothetical protein